MLKLCTSQKYIKHMLSFWPTARQFTMNAEESQIKGFLAN